MNAPVAQPFSLLDAALYVLSLRPDSPCPECHEHNCNAVPCDRCSRHAYSVVEVREGDSRVLCQRCVSLADCSSCQKPFPRYLLVSIDGDSHCQGCCGMDPRAL
ncbi:MAG TPA: hypothetical protein VGP93_07390 [Polyangiaceae bacterium]|jgi:hypothetical protein|nr:hypothetical protein [Polyangiaceae bacterium]